jgi:hypothetical protein
METQTYSGLFSPGGCLTAQAFRRYLNGSLRYAEKLKVEKHLRHCLICFNALEGFKRHKNYDFLNSDLEFLSGKIRNRYAANKKTRRVIPVLVVFSLIIFFIIIFAIYYLFRYLQLGP